MRIGTIMALIAAAILICSVSAFFFSTASFPKAAPSPRPLPKQALDTYKMQTALNFLNKYAPEIDLTTDVGQKRLELLIESHLETESTDDLILLYEAFPRAFEYKELASIAVAKAYLASQQTLAYAALRKLWKNHEREPETWFFMDAESLILDKRYSEAISLLSSRTFKNEAETDRLVRLALLFLIEDPKRAWQYLSEASSKDPGNPLLNLFKAHVLETANKPDIALNEHLFAVQKEMTDPFIREQLADFYIRKNDYFSALQLLQDSLASPSSDSIWLKFLFFNRITTPMSLDWVKANIHQMPQGDQSPFIAYLLDLPSGIFWNETLFNRLPQSQFFLRNNQETFWLRLLMALKSNREEEALALLRENIFHTTSWMPELECHLKTVLNYRKVTRQSLPLASDDFSQKSTSPQTTCSLLTMLSHLSNEQLQSTHIAKDLDQFLKSQEIFSALFLLANWDEAALQLHVLPVFPSTFPDWIAEKFTEVLGRNRGAAQAVTFALQQKQTPSLDFLIVKQAIAANETDLAIDRLQGLYQRKDGIGLQAAKLLASLYLEQGNDLGIKEAILAQPELAKETVSKEILAKIALRSGDLTAATALYLDLKDDSPEAQAFLAQQAFANKDWKQARTLTEALLKKYPDHVTLQNNLHHILLEEQKEKLNKKH